MRLRNGVIATLLTGLLIVSAGCGGDEEAPPASGKSFSDLVAEAQRDTIPVRRARRLVEIGQQQHDAADVSGAQNTWRQARLSCAEVKEPASRARAYALLALSYAKGGMDSNAKLSIEEATKAVAEIPTDELAGLMSKIDAVAEVAKAQGAAGDRNGAVLALRDAEKLVDQIAEGDDPDLAASRRSEVLNAVAVAYFRIERQQDCQRLLEESQKLAEAIGKTRGRADAVAALAMAQHQADPEAAAATFDRAIEIARQIEDELSRGHGLTDIAIKLQQVRRGNQADQLLQEAESVAEKVKDSGLRKGLMEKIYKARS